MRKTFGDPARRPQSSVILQRAKEERIATFDITSLALWVILPRS
jgi:hypothetical protein